MFVELVTLLHAGSKRRSQNKGVDVGRRGKIHIADHIVSLTGAELVESGIVVGRADMEVRDVVGNTVVARIAGSCRLVKGIFYRKRSCWGKGLMTVMVDEEVDEEVEELTTADKQGTIENGNQHEAE